MKEYVDVDERTVSELCVPIKFKERILGVINAESTKKGAFTEDDERLLITLAGQIATALEQIRKKRQAERKWLDSCSSNDLIYALAQITTHIEKAFSIDDIIRNLGEELSKIDLTCIMAVYDRSEPVYGQLHVPGPEIAGDDRTGSWVSTCSIHVFSRSIKTENILYPTALPNVEDEIQMLFARTRGRDISGTLRKIGIGPETEPVRLPLIFENLLGIYGSGERD
jgi:hypothetical protein